MGKASTNGNSKAEDAKPGAFIGNVKSNNDEYLKVHVQGRPDPFFLPFHSNKNVRFKDLRAKLPRASCLTLKKNDATQMCDMTNGMILEPDVGWDSGRVWAVVEPKASEADKASRPSKADKASRQRNKLLAQLLPANRLPVHLNLIWKPFNVSCWEELFASPRFSSWMQCNVAKFIQYRNGVVQLFTKMIIRQGPDGFDCFTMFRISEGDRRICDVLKELLKDSRNCICCDMELPNSFEALRHYFDLEHAIRSRKVFDEPVYVSAILESAREHGMFLPIQVFETDDNDTSAVSKKKKKKHRSTAESSSSEALKPVKVEIVQVISPSVSPRTNPNSLMASNSSSLSAPSSFVEPVEAETHREPTISPPPALQTAQFRPQTAPLPLQAVNQPINEQQRIAMYQHGFNGYALTMQPPFVPVYHGYGMNPNALAVNPPVHNVNYGRHPNSIHQIPDTTLPPPYATGFFFAPPVSGSGPSNGIPRSMREAVVPSVPSAYPPELVHPRQDSYEPEPSRPSRRQQDCGTAEAAPTQTIRPAKRGNSRNANHEPLPIASKGPATVQAPRHIKVSKRIQGNANLEPIPASVAKMRAPPDDSIDASPMATSPPAKKSKRATENVNLEPIPASISKVDEPIKVKVPTPQGKHIIFSSDDEFDVSPTPQPNAASRPGLQKVTPDSSSESSDDEEEDTPSPQPPKASRPGRKQETSESSDDREQVVPRPNTASRPGWKKVMSSSSSESSDDEEVTPPPQPPKASQPRRKQVESESSDDREEIVPRPNTASRPGWKKVMSSSSSESSDNEEEVTPPPQPPKAPRPGRKQVTSEPSDDAAQMVPQPSTAYRPGGNWRKVLSSSSSESSDSEDPPVSNQQRSEPKKAPEPAPPPAKRVKVTAQSSKPPPPQKSRTTSASATATPPSAKKKAAPKSKRKSKDPPPVVEVSSDSEAPEASVPETGTKQPTTRREMEPYVDYTPEYKVDLTTRLVTRNDLLQYFNVKTEAALFKLPAFRLPVMIPNLQEFLDYRSFLLRCARLFLTRQRPDIPVVFYMFKALKTDDIYLADIDRSYARNCTKCDNAPLTLNHLFDKGHLMMFQRYRLDEIQIGIDYIRDQLRNTTGCNSEEYDIEPGNSAFHHLLHIYHASTIDELCLNPSFRSSLLPAEEVKQFQAQIIQAIVNTNSPKLPFIVLHTFSIDKLVYLRDHLASNQPLQVRCDEEETPGCRCGKGAKGHLYVVHVLKENHLNMSAFETLKNIMDDMFLIRVHGPPKISFTTIKDLKRCPFGELNRILRGWRRIRERSDRKEADQHLNAKIAAIEAELNRRGCPLP